MSDDLGTIDATDSVLAEKFAAEVLTAGRRFRWTKGLGWVRWTGTHWQTDDVAEEEVMEAARRWARKRFNEQAKLLQTGQIDAKALKQKMALLTRSKLSAVVALAKGMDGVLTPTEAFDAHPTWLNTRSGVVDLQTGALYAHDPDHLLTKITSAGYVQGARHNSWDKALKAIPADVQEWLQIRYGQALYGFPPSDDLMQTAHRCARSGRH